jgi:hypothetical protein
MSALAPSPKDPASAHDWWHAVESKWRTVDGVPAQLLYALRTYATHAPLARVATLAVGAWIKIMGVDALHAFEAVGLRDKQITTTLVKHAHDIVAKRDLHS